MPFAVRPDGATFIGPSVEEEKAQAHASDAEVVAWSDGEDPYELVQRALGRGAEIGVEKEHLTLHGAEVLTSRTGAAELLDVGEEIRRLRLIKHEDEIARLIRAAQITDDAYTHVLARLHAGMSEIEVALLVGSVIGELGGVLSFPTLVQSGPNSAMPHLEPSSRKLSAGELRPADVRAAHASLP